MSDKTICCVKDCTQPRWNKYSRCEAHQKAQWKSYRTTPTATATAAPEAAPVRVNVCPMCKRTARAAAELALSEGRFCSGCAASLGAAKRILRSNPPHQPVLVEQAASIEEGQRLKLALLSNGRDDTSYRVRRVVVAVLEEMDEVIPATSRYAMWREKLLADGFTVYHEF